MKAWAPSQYKNRLSLHRTPMLKTRWSQDRLIFDMGISILVRRHLYIEAATQAQDIGIFASPDMFLPPVIVKQLNEWINQFFTFWFVTCHIGIDIAHIRTHTLLALGYIDKILSSVKRLNSISWNGDYSCFKQLDINLGGKNGNLAHIEGHLCSISWSFEILEHHAVVKTHSNIQ